MVENKFTEKLVEMDFIKINSNTEGIYLLYKIIQEEAHIVSVVQLNSGDEFTLDQYEHILSQIKNNFINRGFGVVHILSLIFTYEPQNARQLCIDENDHWIIDLASDQLIIYENQSSDFLGLKDMLEKVLEDDRYEIERQEDSEETMSSFKAQWVSPFNTVIVAINVLVFIIVNKIAYYTGLFGGAEKLITKGALAYSDITKNHEYYRILTSMFLHANTEHLFNNMLVLMFVGANLEKAIGKFKYLFIYFGAGIIAGFSSIGYNMLISDKVSGIGASGAIFGVVGAMLYILIINKGQLQNISSWQMIIFAVLSLYGGFVSIGIDNTAHIGGFIGGFLLAAIVYRRRKEEDVIKESIG